MSDQGNMKPLHPQGQVHEVSQNEEAKAGDQHGAPAQPSGEDAERARREMAARSVKENEGGPPQMPVGGGAAGLSMDDLRRGGSPDPSDAEVARRNREAWAAPDAPPHMPLGASDQQSGNLTPRIDMTPAHSHTARLHAARNAAMGAKRRLMLDELSDAVVHLVDVLLEKEPEHQEQQRAKKEREEAERAERERQQQQPENG